MEENERDALRRKGELPVRRELLPSAPGVLDDGAAGIQSLRHEIPLPGQPAYQ